MNKYCIIRCKTICKTGANVSYHTLSCSVDEPTKLFLLQHKVQLNKNNSYNDIMSIMNTMINPYIYNEIQCHVSNYYTNNIFKTSPDYITFNNV
jgi:hypothetical protein